jgi:GNAT superfamily N-acetyltransferase
MPGYRFCRSDDIPLLVAAHNACWVPHFGSESAITVDDFKRGIREIGLWSSSCVVAFEGDEPIGVLIAAKRDGVANFVHRLAVRPGYERQGHGRHMLTSLVDKAAILKPDRVVTEVPSEWTGARRFLERSGFVAEATYVDLVRDAGGTSGGDDPRRALVVPIGFGEVVESGFLDARPRRPWARSVASLRARAGELEGLAVATDRLEAFVLFASADAGGDRTVVAFGGADAATRSALLGVLLACAQPATGRLTIATLDVDDPAAAELEAFGFRRARESIGYVAARAG